MITGTWFGAWAGFTFGPEAGVAVGSCRGRRVRAGAWPSSPWGSASTRRWPASRSTCSPQASPASCRRSSSTASAPGPSPSRRRCRRCPDVSLPGAEPLLAPCADAGIPIVSDAAAVVLGFTTNVNVLTILAFARRPGHGVAPVPHEARAPDPVRGRGSGCRGLAGRQPQPVTGSSPLAVSGRARCARRRVPRHGRLEHLQRGPDRRARVHRHGHRHLRQLDARPDGLGAYLFGFTDALRTRQEATINALLVVGGRRPVPGARARSGPAAPPRPHRRRVRRPRRGLHRLVRPGRRGADPSSSPSHPQVTTLLVLALARQDLRPPRGVPYRAVSRAEPGAGAGPRS